MVSGHHTLPWASRLRLNQSTPGLMNGGWFGKQVHEPFGCKINEERTILGCWCLNQASGRYARSLGSIVSMVGNKALYTTKQKKCCFNHYLSCLRSKSVLKPGWWYTNPSEKYEFVSWDYDIPNLWKNTNNQKLFPHKLADFFDFVHHPIPLLVI